MTSAEHSAAMIAFESRPKGVQALWYQFGEEKARREMAYGMTEPTQKTQGLSDSYWWRGYSETWAKAKERVK